MQVQVEVLSRAGMLAITTLGAPGVQGVVVFGMQGCGVNTPKAAVVAAATCGFIGVEHMPNGMMLTIGLKSWIVASGWLSTFVRLSGKTVKVDGDEPNEHINFAPLTTCKGMSAPSLVQIGANAITTGIRAESAMRLPGRPRREQGRGAAARPSGKLTAS
jgi:hypothetical protein